MRYYKLQERNKSVNGAVIALSDLDQLDGNYSGGEYEFKKVASDGNSEIYDLYHGWLLPIKKENVQVKVSRSGGLELMNQSDQKMFLSEIDRTTAEDIRIKSAFWDMQYAWWHGL